MFSLKGKVALITGGSSGIGAATAIVLSKFGSQVSITGRNMENLQKTEQECIRAGCYPKDILKVTGDVFKDGDRILQETISKFGSLDILVNNAGIQEPGPLAVYDNAHFDRMFDINVKAAMYLSKIATPHLKSAKGSIVNVSSVSGTNSFKNKIVYNMSKSALDQFTKCAALELAEDGIRVNSVNPGVVVTELHKRGGLSDEAYNAFLERCKTTHPLGRAAYPQEVAYVIAFLASDMAAQTTGALLHVDGGRHLTCFR